jgi:hypothetical protein
MGNTVDETGRVFVLAKDVYLESPKHRRRLLGARGRSSRFQEPQLEKGPQEKLGRA